MGPAIAPSDGSTTITFHKCAGTVTSIDNAIEVPWVLSILTYRRWSAEIQGLEVNAWSSLAEGRNDLALTMMKSAAEMEDGTDKKAITPGPLAPARELFGEMLLAINQPTQALEQFEATLKKEPNRFRALYGAARAAQLSGNREASRTYFAELLKVCERADKPGRVEVLEANKAVLVN